MANDSDLLPQYGLYALSRVRRSADSIANQVRPMLSSCGSEFQPMKILVVDDQPDAADAMATVLGLLGCPVRACYSGIAALAMAETFEPQLCVLDLMMPDMDGLELACRLKVGAKARPLLLVATTPFSDFESKTSSALAGFHEHLIKPVDVRTLIDALTRLGQIFIVPSFEASNTVVYSSLQANASP